MLVKISKEELEQKKTREEDKKGPLEGKETQEEDKRDVKVEEQAEKIEAPSVETFLASDKEPTMNVTFQSPKKLVDAIRSCADLFNITYGDLIRSAVIDKIAKLQDISFLEEALKTDSVDEIIGNLRTLKKAYLTPKALSRIHKFLKDKNCTSGLNKFDEFCAKTHLSDEIKELIEDNSLIEVVYLKWSNPDVKAFTENLLETGKKAATEALKLAVLAAVI